MCPQQRSVVLSHVNPFFCFNPKLLSPSEVRHSPLTANLGLPTDYYRLLLNEAKKVLLIFFLFSLSPATPLPSSVRTRVLSRQAAECHTRRIFRRLLIG